MSFLVRKELVTINSVNEIRNEMLLVRLKDREVINKIKISEGEIDNFLYNQEQSSENSRRIPTFPHYDKNSRSSQPGKN